MVDHGYLSKLRVFKKIVCQARKSDHMRESNIIHKQMVAYYFNKMRFLILRTLNEFLK